MGAWTLARSTALAATKQGASRQRRQRRKWLSGSRRGQQLQPSTEGRPDHYLRRLLELIPEDGLAIYTLLFAAWDPTKQSFRIAILCIAVASMGLLAWLGNRSARRADPTGANKRWVAPCALSTFALLCYISVLPNNAFQEVISLHIAAGIAITASFILPAVARELNIGMGPPK